MSCSISYRRAAPQEQLSFISPAKINLFFQILYKRDDGFHEIASLYQAINLFDILHVALAEKDLFTCSDPSLKMDEHNLVMKALSLFRLKTKNDQPFHIHLEKKIPMQAGLGGGSSNAATALWAFSKLLELNISEEDLKSWSACLGSDVPFFFSSGTAYCTGRGDKLVEVSPVEILENIWIAKPECGLSTPLVYAACKPVFFSSRDPEESLRSFSTKTPSFYNDLEGPAFSISPFLEKLKEKLLEIGFEKVLLSGSGTSFFCIGSVSVPILEGVQFFRVKPIQRKASSWYKE